MRHLRGPRKHASACRYVSCWFDGHNQTEICRDLVIVCLRMHPHVQSSPGPITERLHLLFGATFLLTHQRNAAYANVVANFINGFGQVGFALFRCGDDGSAVTIGRSPVGGFDYDIE